MRSRLDPCIVTVAALAGLACGCQQIFGLEHPAQGDGGLGDGHASTDGVIVDVMNDRDGDGIMDPVDDCPDDFDPGQADEDGDTLGDICDPCPVDADNSDGDADGVGGVCDPHPMVGGDQIALFEGFQQGIPVSWTKLGNWTSANGSIAVATAVSGYADLYLPAFSTHETVSIGGAMLSAPGNDFRTIGVQDDTDPTGYSIVCSLLITSSTDNVPDTPMVDMYRLPAESALKRSSYAWGVGNQLVVRMTRNGTGYACEGQDITAGTNRVVVANDGTITPNPQLGIHVFSASDRFDWLMVVTSP